MAADEYYDAVGDVLSYVLSAEDEIITQITSEPQIWFQIDRDGTYLDLIAKPNKRYFNLRYRYSFTAQLKTKYQEKNQLRRGHMDRNDIDESVLRDEKLDDIIAYERISEMENNSKDATKVIENIRELIPHSDCKIRTLTTTDPREEDSQVELWDGISALGLLYPYEDSFGPRDYEIVAQEVISVGNQIDKRLGELEVMEEVGVS